MARARCSRDMNEHLELVDIVDRADLVTATVTRAEMRAARLRHRAVFIAIVHPDGRLLIHERSAHKDLWPSMWDIAVGGVVSAGESYDEAARRELAEELGIDAVPEALDDGASFEDDDVSLIGRCYRVVHAGPFTFADAEVVRAEFVLVDDLAADRRRFVPDSIALMLPRLTPPAT
jgi:8-oxo-dGTP pyrophosphatase MutT (NUDIX family)